MQRKLSFDFLEEVKTRSQIALASNNGAAVREPSPVVSVTEENCKAHTSDIKNEENGQSTYPISPYYNDVESIGSFPTWNPLLEFDRYQKPVFRLLHVEYILPNYGYAKAARLFDFDYWLEVNRKHVAGFERAECFGLKDLQKNVIFKLADLYKRYEAQALQMGKNSSNVMVTGLVRDFEKNTQNPDSLCLTKLEVPVQIGFTEYCFMKRLQALYFWLWYSVIGLMVERVNEFDHWIESMSVSCCSIHLENVSICIQTIGGHRVDDRDSFLAKLRPHFQNHANRLATMTVTCDCAEGLTQ